MLTLTALSIVLMAAVVVGFCIDTIDTLNSETRFIEKSLQLSDSASNKILGTKNLLDASTSKITKQAYDRYLELFKDSQKQPQNRIKGKADYNKRYSIFKERAEKILESQLAYANGQKSFSIGFNQFTDLTSEELAEKLSVILPENDEDFVGMTTNDKEELKIISDDMLIVGKKKSVNLTINYDHKNYLLHSSNDEFVDLRLSGCLRTPESQGQCGSCTSFAIIAAIEALHCLKNQSKVKSRELISLSKQQLVDCSVSKLSGKKFSGCEGRMPKDVLDYIKSNNLIAKEECYPYKAKYSGKCMLSDVKKKNCTIKPVIKYVNLASSFFKLGSRNIINKMQKHLKNYGPLVVSAYVQEPFFEYSRGVYEDSKDMKHKIVGCHAMTLVGFDASRKGHGHWIVKNSWGTSWGDGGFGRIKFGSMRIEMQPFGIQ